MQEGFLCPKDLPSIPLRTSENRTKNIATTDAVGYCTICNCESQRSDVVRDHAVRDVFQVVELARVRGRPRDLLNRREDRRGNGGGVVARLPLQHLRDALEAHPLLEVVHSHLLLPFLDRDVELLE